MNYDEIFGSALAPFDGEDYAEFRGKIYAAGRKCAAQALRDVCDELMEKYEGQGKTLSVAVMHIRAKAAELRRTTP